MNDKYGYFDVPLEAQLVNKISNEWNKFSSDCQKKTALWLMNNAEEITIKSKIKDILISDIDEIGLDNDDMKILMSRSNIIDAVYDNIHSIGNDKVFTSAIINSLSVVC